MMLEAQLCDHNGEIWSQDTADVCTCCGARLFLPPRYLAYLPGATIVRMHALWRAAGWPSFGGGGWLVDEHVRFFDVPDFVHVGGLPVHHDSLVLFAQALQGGAT